MPGSWKTTIWKSLAEKLNMGFLDFDDDVIENEMWKTVWEVLDELGEEKFLNLEEKLTLNLNITNTVLATSGSVPLKENAMNYLKSIWIVIYIDIPISTIKSRLESMKIDRIVWMKDMTMDEILVYRKSFYEKSYDYKFTVLGLWEKQEVFKEFMQFFEKLNLE
jgi:shikimate kinase